MSKDDSIYSARKTKERQKLVTKLLNVLLGVTGTWVVLGLYIIVSNGFGGL